MIRRALKAIARPLVRVIRKHVQFHQRLARYKRIARGDFVSDERHLLSDYGRVVHALDKGLAREDWTPGHGRKAYEDAKRIREMIQSEYPGTLNEEIVRWGDDVLHQYEHREFSKSAGRTERPRQQTASQDRSGLSVDEIILLRRSSRIFECTPVGKSVLESVASKAFEAPSSCSRNTTALYASNQPTEVQKVLTNFPGFTGFSQYVPACIVFAVDLRGYSMPSELFAPSIDAALGMENVVLSAYSRGLSVVLLSWAARNRIQDRRLRDLLKLPDYYEIVAGAAVGYPEYEASKPAKYDARKGLYWISNEPQS